MPFPKRDVGGQRFARLIVTGDVARRDNTKHRCVACRCDCGTEIVVRLGSLRSGRTKSCGCLNREQLAAHHQAIQRPLIGHRYGRLLVSAVAPSRQVNGKWHGYWVCRCDCGNETTVQRSALTSRATTSCGCYQQERVAVRSRKHGASGEGRRWPEYLVWAAMLQRCKNPNNPAFKDYGGRGIMVCERWRTFANFIDDMGRRPASGFQLDRRRNNDGYSKDNCQWVTREQNMQNRSFISREEAEAFKAEIARLQHELETMKLLCEKYQHE